MKNFRLLIAALALCLVVSPLLGQSLTITKDFAQVPMASVLAMYKNQFGKWEKPDLDVTFPYAVVRMHLDGNAREVTVAKQRLTLYMGTQTAVLDRYTGNSNEILFLIPARRPTVYVDCGDGCDRVLLVENLQLQPNSVYGCSVQLELEEDFKEEETIDKEALKQELLNELAGLLQSQQVIQNMQPKEEEKPVEEQMPVVEEEKVEDIKPIDEPMVDEERATFLQVDTDTLSKYASYSQNVRIKTMLLGQVGYSMSSQLSYGAMFGQMYKGYGWYVNARSNFQFGHTAVVGSCGADGLVDGVQPFYSGKTRSSHLAVHAGFVMNVLEKATKNKFHTLGLYIGGGYGKRELLAETTNGEWIKYAPTSQTGVAGNVGLFGSVAGVTLNVGVSTINFKYMDFEVGIGFMF